MADDLANPSAGFAGATMPSATPQSDAPGPLWTVKQVSVFLNVTPGTVYKMVERGELPAVRLGVNRRTVRFREDAVHAWVHERG